jgi:hypothetical protein
LSLAESTLSLARAPVSPLPSPGTARAILRRDPSTLTHLQQLEAESIHILRETVAESENPVML